MFQDYANVCWLLISVQIKNNVSRLNIPDGNFTISVLIEYLLKAIIDIYAGPPACEDESHAIVIGGHTSQSYVRMIFLVKLHRSAKLLRFFFPWTALIANRTVCRSRELYPID